MEVPKQVCRAKQLALSEFLWFDAALYYVFYFCACWLTGELFAWSLFKVFHTLFFSLHLWRNACSIGNWSLLFACQQPLFQDYLSCGLGWQEISLQRGSSSQLQPGQAVTEFCVWTASMMEVDAPLAYGSTAGSNSCWDLNTSLFQKNNN